MDAHELTLDLLRQNCPKPCRRVLDVGCGSGEFLRQASRMLGARGCGVDPFAPDTQDSEPCFRPLSAEEIRQLPGRFDGIYSAISFHHFREPAPFLKIAAEKLSWFGVLVIVDWKQGTDTGIPERYYSLEQLERFFGGAPVDLLHSGQTSDLIFAVAALSKRRLAAATEDRQSIFQGMLGRAPGHEILELDTQFRWKFLEYRPNPYQKTLQHQKTLDVYAKLQDCQGFLSYRIGKKGVERLQNLGATLFFGSGALDTALDKIREETREFFLQRTQRNKGDR